MAKKELIEKSIVINGIGRKDLKTIFSIEKEEDKKDQLYFSIEKISGRRLVVDFKYLDNTTETESKILITIPFNLNEEEVKQFILQEIDKTL
jgi:hypothetical protein